MSSLPDIDAAQRTEIEAAVYRKMVEHLRSHPEVQNIDLMNLGYFCRNCISRWYRNAAADQGVAMEESAAREIVYGMPYPEYRATHQRESSEQQRRLFEDARLKATE